jgi:hypothetical protein
MMQIARPYRPLTLFAAASWRRPSRRTTDPVSPVRGSSARSRRRGRNGRRHCWEGGRWHLATHFVPPGGWEATDFGQLCEKPRLFSAVVTPTGGATAGD